MFEEYKYTIGAHAHAFPVSCCSTLTVGNLVQLYASKGADAFILTNHFYPRYVDNMGVDGAFNFVMENYYLAKRLGNMLGIRVLLGLEPAFQGSSDCLVFGADEQIIHDIIERIHMSAEDFRRDYKNDKMFFAQAHPFRWGMRLVDPSLLDGVEAFNVNPGHYGQNARAAEYATKHNLIPTCGDDCHSTNECCLATFKTKILPEDSLEFAKILFSKDYLIDIGGMKVVPQTYNAL